MTTPLAAESYGVAAVLDAWEGSLHAVNELGRRLNADGWAAPTECPGWSAGDVVRHLCWIEALLAGRTDPPVEIDWDTRPHVRNELSRRTEAGVEVRRAHAQADVCAELDGLIDVRLAQLMALDPLTLDTQVTGISGRPTTLLRLLRVRAFDTWTHEQDVRRAVGLPGNLATPGAQQSAAQIASALPFMLAEVADAPVGTTHAGHGDRSDRVRALRSPGRRRHLRRVRPGRRDDRRPHHRLETLARLAGGRLDLSDPAVLARVELAGDPALAAQLPRALAITP